jgi:hypothetical protein
MPDTVRCYKRVVARHCFGSDYFGPAAHGCFHAEDLADLAVAVSVVAVPVVEVPAAAVPAVAGHGGFVAPLVL